MLIKQYNAQNALSFGKNHESNIDLLNLSVAMKFLMFFSAATVLMSCVWFLLVLSCGLVYKGGT